MFTKIEKEPVYNTTKLFIKTPTRQIQYESKRFIPGNCILFVEC